VKDPHRTAAYLLDLFARRALSDRMLRGLAPGQWVVLRRLHADAGQGCSLRQIARTLDANINSTERCIRALESKGLVTTAREGSTGRVRLTEVGRRYLLDDPLLWIDGALIRLPPQDKSELCRMLTILLDAHAMDASARREEIRERRERLTGIRGLEVQRAGSRRRRRRA
jgi:DNA-binding MarR family transcriptional regulator